MSVIGDLFGGGQADAAQQAAEIQAQSADKANALQQSEFQQQQANLAPWITAGGDALSVLTSGLQPGGQFNLPFSLSMFQQDPGYNFQKQEGDAAISNGAAARGTNLSPATIEALMNFNQGLAANSYGNAWSRYNSDTNKVLGATEALANTGLSTTNNLNSLGGNNASVQGNNIIGAANAKAAGLVGGANAKASGTNNLLQTGLNAYFMNQMLGQGGGGLLGGMQSGPIGPWMNVNTGELSSIVPSLSGSAAGGGALDSLGGSGIIDALGSSGAGDTLASLGEAIAMMA